MSTSRDKFCVPTIGVVCGNHSTKQKTQELDCLGPWPIKHGAVLLIWNDLVCRKNLSMRIDV